MLRAACRQDGSGPLQFNGALAVYSNTEHRALPVQLWVARLFHSSAIRYQSLASGPYLGAVIAASLPSNGCTAHSGPNRGAGGPHTAARGMLQAVGAASPAPSCSALRWQQRALLSTPYRRQPRQTGSSGTMASAATAGGGGGTSGGGSGVARAAGNAASNIVAASAGNGNGSTAATSSPSSGPSSSGIRSAADASKDAAVELLRQDVTELRTLLVAQAKLVQAQQQHIQKLEATVELQGGAAAAATTAAAAAGLAAAEAAGGAAAAAAASGPSSAAQQQQEQQQQHQGVDGPSLILEGIKAEEMRSNRQAETAALYDRRLSGVFDARYHSTAWWVWLPPDGWHWRGWLVIDGC